MLAGSPAVICSMLSPKAKRIGDIFAGTVVISERGPRLAPPPAMPPSLAWWASSLQLSGLDAGQAEVARQFLSRATQLDPQLRQQMAYRIAGDVVSRIAPPPPPGAPPELVLAAVLAERHRRELARLRAVFPGPPGPLGRPGHLARAAGRTGAVARRCAAAFSASQRSAAPGLPQPERARRQRPAGSRRQTDCSNFDRQNCMDTQMAHMTAQFFSATVVSAVSAERAGRLEACSSSPSSVTAKPGCP